MSQEREIVFDLDEKTYEKLLELGTNPITGRCEQQSNFYFMPSGLINSKAMFRFRCTEESVTKRHWEATFKGPSTFDTQGIRTCTEINQTLTQDGYGILHGMGGSPILAEMEALCPGISQTLSAPSLGWVLYLDSIQTIRNYITPYGVEMCLDNSQINKKGCLKQTFCVLEIEHEDPEVIQMVSNRLKIDYPSITPTKKSKFKRLLEAQ